MRSMKYILHVIFFLTVSHWKQTTRLFQTQNGKRQPEATCIVKPCCWDGNIFLIAGYWTTFHLGFIFVAKCCWAKNINVYYCQNDPLAHRYYRFTDWKAIIFLSYRLFQSGSIELKFKNVYISSFGYLNTF